LVSIIHGKISPDGFAHIGHRKKGTGQEIRLVPLRGRSDENDFP